MDNTKVSVIAVDIIHVANIDIRLELSTNDLSKIGQMPHDVEDQLNECTSTFFHISSQMNFFSQDGYSMFP